MKHLFIFLSIMLLTTHCFSQNDSLIFQNRKFITLSTNLFTRSNQYNYPNAYQSNGYGTNLALNLSLGSFTKNSIANVFTLGIKDSNSGYDTDRVNESDWKINVAYAREKYVMLSKRIAVYGGLEGSIYYESISKKGQDSYNNVLYKNESTTTEVGVSARAYPGIIYFINSKWAINATIGNLGIFSVSNKENNGFSDYGDNNVLYTSFSTESRLDYNFSPYFSILNSGIGIRYFFQ
jgi:hypothetical protein